MRIALWGFAGFVVAGLWAMVSILTFPMALQSFGPVFWAVLSITMPIASASLHFHFPVSIYATLVINAATYAAVGTLVELLRVKSRPAL